MFRFLHAADMHIDSPFRGMTALPAVIRERVRESTFRALDAMIELALRERVDFAVISGDVYDAADRSLRAQLRFQGALRRLAAGGIPVYVAHGNHDPADGRSAKLQWPEKVHFFPADRVETHRVELPGRGLVAEVHGISYATAAVTDNLAQRFRPGSPGIFQLAVLHANVDGDEGYDNYAPCSLRDLSGSGIDYWALGHIHSRRTLNERPWVVYPGNPQGRSVRELGPRGCCIVNVGVGGEVRIDFHALDDVRWAMERIDISVLETEQELHDELISALERVRGEADGRAAFVRLVLEGRGPLHTVLRAGKVSADLEASLREEAAAQARAGAGDWVWVESLEDLTAPAADFDQLLEQAGFVGELLRQARELSGSGPELEAFASAAAEPLLAAVGRRLDGGWLLQRQRELLRRAETRLVDALYDEGGGAG